MLFLDWFIFNPKSSLLQYTSFVNNFIRLLEFFLILEIGGRIKNRRKELHLTGKQIKDAVGISTGNLSDIENGKILPSSSALIGLSKVLECSCDYILLGKSHISEFSSNSNMRDSERILLEQFRNLPDDDQEEILMMVQLKYNRTQKSKEAEVTSSISRSGNGIDEIA